MKIPRILTSAIKLLTLHMSRENRHHRHHDCHMIAGQAFTYLMKGKLFSTHFEDDN
jgi:hypothetical protein